MQRIFRIALTVCAMLLVASMTSLLSLRLAIHGREVVVPDLAGRSDADAAASARKLGLNLSVENRFYSAGFALNHVLSQAPAPGVRVRRGSQVRVTESLGGEHVSAPDVTGESERPALLMLGHLQLDPAPEAHLPAAGPPGVVLAQSPSPHTVDASGPRVALLVSGEPVDPALFAYVMPSLTGMTVESATTLLASAGLRLASVVDPAAPLARANLVHLLSNSGAASGQLPGASSLGANPAHHAAINTAAVIATQSPAPGSRVTRADAIRVTTVGTGVSTLP